MRHLSRYTSHHIRRQPRDVVPGGCTGTAEEIEERDDARLMRAIRFRGIVFAAVKTSRRTNSPIPGWAEAKVIEAMDSGF